VHHGRQRGDVQQVATAFGDLLDHGPVGAPHAQQVDRQRSLHLRDWSAGERAGEREAGVRDRHVDRAEALDGATHRALQSVEVADVGFEAGCAIAEAGGVLLKTLGLESDERNVCALGVQPLGGSRSDPARGPGDEDGATVDVEGRAGAAQASAHELCSRALPVCTTGRAQPTRRL
jgi:hypothetical protein